MRVLFFLLLTSPLFANTAIIGGGVSGTYLGVQLAGTGHVSIYEATDRIGGRLYTTFFPDMPSTPVELGGMRFSSNDHRVVQLVHALNLETVPFSSETHLCYLRGVRLKYKDLTTRKLPYRLPKSERGKTPQRLIKNVLAYVDPALPMMTFEAWQQARDELTYEGKPLEEVSWQNFLSEHLSEEGYQLLADLGYIQQVANVSIYTAVGAWLKKGGPSWSLKQGYQKVPLLLAEQFKEQRGSIYLQKSLLSIEKQGSDYLLHFDDATIERAKTVILTLTPPALSRLFANSPTLLTKEPMERLAHFESNPLTKLFLVYPTAWWQRVGIERGSSLTSMPIRNTFYFGEDRGGALLLASYQGLYTPFWQSLNGVADLGEDARWQAEHEVQVLNGVHDAPRAKMGRFINWMEAPHYGAYFFWGVGVKPQQEIEALMRPFEDEEIYISSSWLSENQGWVEGALECAETLLETYFEDVWKKDEEITEAG